MLEKIIGLLAAFVIATISHLGYAGIVLLMAIESACIPLPSEIILPFSGYLVFRGEMNLWLVALAGAFGCVLGSLVAYYVGRFGGRQLVERYGRYVLISQRDLALADHWFARHGDITIFVGRLLPVVRTFIALPAGIAGMEIKRFVLYTFAGSFLWSLGLVEIGVKLGENWDTLGPYFHRFDVVIVAVLALGAGLYVYRHLRHG
ncbi:alkaline phosphatase [Acidihalobacter yilgarnensis]|uniref:Alkaline phosphatase n=1 Tax=Acidihalobacter yilgarnensis TaxID=2819280 RepID=A0A1D8IT13_9GAMM|nr:DedA family protein [Acidihalobacter yilgarnensis]AOU99619.1 alkaline phosphatase [Acidihalobacter yilgarnensis]